MGSNSLRPCHNTLGPASGPTQKETSMPYANTVQTAAQSTASTFVINAI